jgi:hypothetical protein
VNPYIPGQAGPSSQPQPLDAGASNPPLPTMGELPCPTGGGLSLEAIKDAHFDRLARKSAANGNNSAIVDEIISLQMELISRIHELFPDSFWLSQPNRVLEYLLHRPKGGNSAKTLYRWLAQLEEGDIFQLYTNTPSFLQDLFDERDKYYEQLRNK